MVSDMPITAPIAQMLSVLLALVAVPSLTRAQLTTCGYCLCDRPSIACDFYQSQDRIKGNINLDEFAPTSGLLRRLQLDPLAYKELYINCKSSKAIKNQRLTRGMLTGYSSLTRVSVVNCDITDIEPDALADLAALRELDVSNNRLARLPPELFRNRTMAVLTLSENSRLSLTAETFRDFSLERLVLSKCGLNEFPWESLRVMRNLHELTLSQNSIRLVPTEATELVTKLRVFYLDENPLTCTCYNQWLRERIDWNRVSPPIIKSSKVPKCGSPPTLLDVELTRLNPGDFPCPAPEIRSVDIRLEPDSAQLICSAAVDRPGSLVWTYRHLPIYPEMPNAYPSRAYKSSGATFRQSVRRTPGYEREKYTLTAQGQDGQTANFSLTLHWPLTSESAAKPKTDPAETDGAGSDSKTGQKLPSEPQKPGLEQTGGGDYFSRKQFTLIEMIIAVVGTFMGTSLIFLLACQGIQWYNRRDKKRWAAGYTGPPYTYSYNSHRPPSHEYDVPRIDQPCLLPKKQQSQQQQPPPLPTQPPPPLPPQHTLPMPPHHTLPPSVGVSLSSTSSGSGASAAVQTLLSKHQHTQHHHPQQMQATSSSSSNGMGETEFLDYGGHRMVFNHA